MYFKVLFILACVQLIKEIKGFVKNNIVVKDGQFAEISMGTYISVGLAVLFYVMIMAICMMPSLLPSILW